METLDELVDADPAHVAVALAARKAWSPVDPQPIPEALELAEDLECVSAELAAIPDVPAPSARLLTDAERELTAARQAVEEADAALAQRQVTADDAARIDAAHAEVLEAEEKAERRLASPLTKKRHNEARDAERELLAVLGFSSYSDYLLSTATLIADPAAPRRAADARRRLADAEAVWSELTGDDVRRRREAVEDRQVELLRRARDLLGGSLPGDDIVGVLRELRTSSDGPDDAPLVAALREAGVDTDAAHALDLAQQFLTEAAEGHARRAALHAELSTIADDLDDVQAELDALPPIAPDIHESDVELDVARDELRRTQHEEQDAHRAAVEARSRAAEHRAATQRIAALEADLEGASAAEQQAGARVTQLDDTIAAAEKEHDAVRRARQAAADRVDAVIDLTEVGRVPTEVYLLARVAAQREVGRAGSVPLVIADAVNGLSVETTQGVLDVIERFAPVVQIVLMSDDPDIEEWARSFGSEGAALRRFSFVTASA